MLWIITGVGNGTWNCSELARDGNLTPLMIMWADFNRLNHDRDPARGCTALHWACHRSDVAVVKALLRRGVEQLLNNDNNTPLMCAVFPPWNWPDSPTPIYVEIITLLLANKADPHAKNTNGWTALHYSAYHGCAPEVLRLLIEAAPSTGRLPEENGNYPADIARAQGQLSTAEFLDGMLMQTSKSARVLA